MLKTTHTQVSNGFIEKTMNRLSGAAVKCFLAICRNTIGWHKDADYISITQIQGMTGLSNTSVVKGIDELEKAECIIKEKTRSITKYSINYTRQSEEITQGKVKKVHSQSEETSHTKETQPKETQQKKLIKHKYGEYKNVLLTDTEYENLKEKLRDREKWITEVDEGIELKGYTYKSHYLAILKWAKKDGGCKVSAGNIPQIKPKYDYKV